MFFFSWQFIVIAAFVAVAVAETAYPAAYSAEAYPAAYPAEAYPEAYPAETYPEAYPTSYPAAYDKPTYDYVSFGHFWAVSLTYYCK